MRDKVKILVVDDQMAVALMMVFLLTRAGCDAQAALDAEKTLRLAQTEMFDLITLDIDLPGTNGFEIYRRLKKLPCCCDTPIIFVSGRPYDEDRQRAFELGAVDYIVKPFEVTDFVFRIKSHAKAKSRPSDVPDENPDPDTQSLCNTP